MAKRLRDVKILEASDWTTDRYKKRGLCSKVA